MPAEDFPMKIDDMDDAIIGVAMQAASRCFLVYDLDKLIRVLTRDLGSEEDAVEWADYNILSTYVGEGTPLVLHPMPAKEAFALIDDLSEKGAWARELAARAKDPLKQVMDYDTILERRRKDAKIQELESRVRELEDQAAKLERELIRMRGDR